MLRKERDSHLRVRICDVYLVSPLKKKKKKKSTLERTFFSVVNYIKPLTQ